MPPRDVTSLFLQLAVMLAVALAGGQVARRFRLPVVVGELIGGIVLGPTVFGALAPASHAWLFPLDGMVWGIRDAVITLGMLFFLFVAGLEVNLASLRWHGRTIAWTSLLGIAAPFALGFGLVWLLPELWGPPAQQSVMTFALFMGTALSISALPVIARILMDLGLSNKPLGAVVMASATVNDVVGWSLFAAILSSVAPEGLPHRPLWMTLGLVVGFSAVVLSLRQWVRHRALQWLKTRLPWPSGFIAAMVVLVLMAAAAAEAIGLHAVFGAFLVGVALARNHEARNRPREVLYQFAMSFFAPLYFVSIGLKANFAASFDLPLVCLVFVIACVGKIGGVGFGAWLGGMPPREALAVGVGMNARGAMEVILATVALESGLIDQRVFVALIVMALVTSVLSGPMMQWLLGLAPAFEAAARTDRPSLQGRLQPRSP